VASFIVGARDESRAFGDLFEKAQAERLAARKAAEDEYVKLARMSLETFVKTGKRADVPKDLPPELSGHRPALLACIILSYAPESHSKNGWHCCHPFY
jgi:hypothetical protein